MSEKRGAMEKTGLRFTAIVPIATMAIAFALTLIALLAGSKQGFMESCNVMTLNTTDIGQNIIKFAPVTKAKSRRGIVATVNGSALDDGELDERGLFSSSASTTSAAPGATATAASGGPFEAIGNFFNGVVQNLTSAVDGALTDAENALVAEVAKELGIAQYYTMHMTTLCQGNLSSPTDPNAQFTSTSCESYSNVTAGTLLQSYIRHSQLPPNRDDQRVGPDSLPAVFQRLRAQDRRQRPGNRDLRVLHFGADREQHDAAPIAGVHLHAEHQLRHVRVPHLLDHRGGVPAGSQHPRDGAGGRHDTRGQHGGNLDRAAIEDGHAVPGDHLGRVCHGPIGHELLGGDLVRGVPD
ncbi:hypothetical protein BP5796_09892 [Coleophoma crateriformis]|uniref:Uncharacterized protein n=1 Tax=Coleophoma crateriformis TaxID=565419 RepID=A0A3D8QU68_9HELO|nr:hypothetical protein BP5796_09892 [Coleophoma crateriformis]